MAEIIRVLNEHSRLLKRLPEAIPEKIGFKAQREILDGGGLGHERHDGDDEPQEGTYCQLDDLVAE
jgi:hypothetical protein